MNSTASVVMEPLIRRKVFATEEEAVRTLLRQYVLQQVSALQRDMARFEREYGMQFEQFAEYLHERSILLEQGELSPEQRQVLGRAIMQEEDDWLEWKVAREMLENWLGLRQEAIE